MMEALKLNEHEQRVYGELFSQCDNDSSGKVTGVKATELFLTSGLPQETLQQITELCGAKRLGHFGRSQFYIALKLIATAQIGLPAQFDSLNSGRELPLPKFVKQIENDSRRMQYVQYGTNSTYMPDTQADQSIGYDRNQASSHQVAQYPLQPISQSMPQQMLQGGLPPPPKHCRRLQSFDSSQQAPLHLNTNNKVHENSQEALSPTKNTFSPSQSPPMSPTQPRGSLQDPGGTQPTPPVIAPGQAPSQHMNSNMHPSMHGSVQGGTHSGVADGSHKMSEKGWASFDNDIHVDQHQVEVQQGLISNENKEWAHFSTDSAGKGDTSSVSSETESVDDVWTITDEQRDYYTNQFRTMQQDLAGHISGGVSKQFFEKSRLPIHELSKIWNLSDVNNDGKLSLDEFCTAMHLVVLRRNDIELPDHLPPSLMPYIPFVNSDEPFATDLPPGSTLKRVSPSSPNQWTTSFPPPDSPTSSSVSSPGSKPTPVNFDNIKPIPADPDSKIVHPVALRMSPEGPLAMDGQKTYNTDGYENLVDQSPSEIGLISPIRKDNPQTAFTDSLIDLGPADAGNLVQPAPQLAARPRPTPKKAQSVPGPSMENQPILLPPPSSQEPSIGDRPNTLALTGEGSAPKPPPRSKAAHGRSSSLDNQLMDMDSDKFEPPPAVPPRPSPKECGAVGGFVGTGEPTDGMTPLLPEAKRTLSQSRDRLGSQDDHLEEAYRRGPMFTSQSSMDKKELQAEIRRLKERNMTLTTLNNELNQELQEAMEQRIALEIQLDHLKPFPSY